MDLTDLETGKIDANPITKAACSRDAGVVPANGLIYTFPKHCICWPMLRDYAALAPARPGGMPRFEDLKFAPEPGPARPPQDRAGRPDEPVALLPPRRPAQREHAGPLPRRLAILWTAALGGRPEGAIADDWRGNYFIRGPVGPPGRRRRPGLRDPARRPSGRGPGCPATARSAGRSRPTAASIPHRRSIAGCACSARRAAGSIACGADDGGVVWRLRAAPLDERIVAYGQIESPWPVPGSVLVVDDVAYFAAGTAAAGRRRDPRLCRRAGLRPRPLGAAPRPGAAEEFLRFQRAGVRQLRPAPARRRRRGHVAMALRPGDRAR